MCPFSSTLESIGDTKAEVAKSVFENYKLQVAQANEINNRALQTALHNINALADLKAAVNKNTMEQMLAAARTDVLIGTNAMAIQREIIRQGEETRALINMLNTQNLNTALINSTRPRSL